MDSELSDFYCRYADNKANREEDGEKMGTEECCIIGSLRPVTYFGSPRLCSGPPSNPPDALCSDSTKMAFTDIQLISGFSHLTPVVGWFFGKYICGISPA